MKMRGPEVANRWGREELFLMERWLFPRSVLHPREYVAFHP
jgi:hypothetical protein